MSDHDLFERFRRTVHRKGLLLPHSRILLAASGGLDSTVLAHLLHRGGYTFAIAHCNFRLRGDDSDRDALFVRALAHRFGVPVHETTIALREQEAGLRQIQLRARVGRYKHFRKILDEYNYEVLCTAHHLDDALETTLLNLIRGTGLAGLRGIPERTDFPTVRPLLDASREDILDYARSHDIEWREDRSNAGDKYKRNAVRHTVVPKLRELGLTDDSLRSTLAHLRSAERLYRRGVEREPGFTWEDSALLVDRQLNQLGPADTLTVLREVTSDMGFTHEQYRQMLEAAGTVRISSDTHVAYISPQSLRLAPVPRPISPTTIDRLPVTLDLPGGQVVLDTVPVPEKLSEAGTQYCRFPGLPLHLRPRQNGDRFAPLGMGGKSKKLSDLFTDEKVPPWQREQVPVLCTAGGEIVLVVGHRIAKPYAIGPGEERVLRVRLKKRSPGPS